MALPIIRGVAPPQPPIPSIILQGHHRNKISDANKQLIIQKHLENLKPRQILPLIHPPVKRKTIVNIINRYKRTNHIILQPRTGRKRKLTDEIIQEICRNQDETNSITLLDHVQKINSNHNINIHKSSIHSTLKKQKFSTKQLYTNPERRYEDETYIQRLLWAEEQLRMTQIEKDLTISIDETGFYMGGSRKRGKSRIGRKAIRKVKACPGSRINVIAAISPTQGLLYFEKRDYSTNGKNFLEFLDNMVHSNPIFQQQPFRLLMDNPNFHKTQAIKQWFETVNHVQTFTPIYSPMLNPIEECFSKWKGGVNKCKKDNVEDLYLAIDAKSATITVNNCQQWFNHSQSFIDDCLNMEEL